MSDLDRILKLSGLVQGNGFEAPVEESKMSDLDIEAQDMSREDFIEAHSGTLGGAEAAGNFWDESKESRDSNEGIETEAICNELNITASNLWVIIHRARTAMALCLKENWF